MKYHRLKDSLAKPHGALTQPHVRLDSKVDIFDIEQVLNEWCK